MARVEITFFTTGNRSAEGGTMPVPRTAGMITEVLASGAASAATVRASTAPGGTGFVRIQAGVDLWVTAGPAPVAVAPAAGAAEAGLPVKAGQATDLAVSAGDRIAVVEG